jgi:hypothetical protein
MFKEIPDKFSIYVALEKKVKVGKFSGMTKVPRVCACAVLYGDSEMREYR